MGKRANPSSKASHPPSGRVRLFVTDVDGTLTDGGITIDENGTETKTFHSHDGLGIRLLQAAGIGVAIVSARRSRAVRLRAKELGVEHVVQGAADKAAAVRRLRERLGVPAEAVAYVGDDLSDLQSIREAGFTAAPCDAAPEVRRAVSHVCARGGGRGAVRDAIEALLRREGLWDAVAAPRTG